MEYYCQEFQLININGATIPGATGTITSHTSTAVAALQLRLEIWPVGSFANLEHTEAM